MGNGLMGSSLGSQKQFILAALPSRLRQTDMKKCPNCGSANLISDVKAVDHNNIMGLSSFPTEVRIDVDPKNIIYPRSQSLSLQANVCAACGLVSYFVGDLHKLRQVFQELGNGKDAIQPKAAADQSDES